MADYYGANIRNATDSERKFFLSKPQVGGYAAEDNSIVLNPFSTLLPKEQEAVARNEGLRIALRKHPELQPKFELTPEQQKAFSAYSKNPQDVKNTVFARIITGDPSAKATQEQSVYANLLHEMLLDEIKTTDKTSR